MHKNINLNQFSIIHDQKKLLARTTPLLVILSIAIHIFWRMPLVTLVTWNLMRRGALSAGEVKTVRASFFYKNVQHLACIAIAKTGPKNWFSPPLRGLPAGWIIRGKTESCLEIKETAFHVAVLFVRQRHIMHILMYFLIISHFLSELEFKK